MEHIFIATDTFFRKTIILISRCPRGGKTTILEMLHRSLQCNNVHVMTVSFNGVAGFVRLVDETPTESLFRLITNQLDEAIDKQSPRVTDWDLLDAYIGNQPFVLLIDELNVLCNTVGSEMARVLKCYFLDKANRHLVVTSHQPFLDAGHEAAGHVQKLWSDSVTELSNRSWTLVPMPVSCDVSLLQGMNATKCSAITPSLAAFYGYMPSLMYAVCVQFQESPSMKFSMVVRDKSTDFALLLDFVIALITGIPFPSLRRFFCFASAVEYKHLLGIRMKWPLCYVSCILRHFSDQPLYEYIAKRIDMLEGGCETVGSGMVWEESVRIAIILRFVAAAKKGWDLPFQLCPATDVEEAHIHVMQLGPGVVTVDDAKTFIEERKVNYQRNTLVLFVPTEAQLHQFDGFCVRYQDCQLCNVCAYQCKDNNRGAAGTVPEWVTEGGHLLRSDAPSFCKMNGKNSKGWTYYNAEDTDDFLGWSLRIMR
jgi:hypothetical protein